MMEHLASEEVEAGRRAMVIPIGASTPLGAIGFIRGAQELTTQVRELGLNLRQIFHATCSGGTQAGLVTGLQLFGPKTTAVIGVSVDDAAAELIRTVNSIMIGLNHLLGLPQGFGTSEIEVDDRFTGDGYAIPSPKGSAATAVLARTEGVILDPVYTAKAMASFLDRAKSQSFTKEDDLLFWHTGGQLALFQEISV